MGVENDGHVLGLHAERAVVQHKVGKQSVRPDRYHGEEEGALGRGAAESAGPLPMRTRAGAEWHVRAAHCSFRLQFPCLEQSGGFHSTVHSDHAERHTRCRSERGTPLLAPCEKQHRERRRAQDDDAHRCEGF